MKELKIHRRTILAVLASASLTTNSFAQPRNESPDLVSGATKPVLLIGLDPEVVDYSHIPDLNASKLRQILFNQEKQLRELGYHAQWCLIDAGPNAHHKAIDVMRTQMFDAVLIGAGIRVPPNNLFLFERLVNAIHHHQPHAKMCFNGTAKDTVKTVQRWV